MYFVCVFVSKEHSGHWSRTNRCQKILPLLWWAQQKGNLHNIHRPPQRISGGFKYASGGKYLKNLFVCMQIVFLQYQVSYLLLLWENPLNSKIKCALIVHLEAWKHILAISFHWVLKVFHLTYRRSKSHGWALNKNEYSRHHSAGLCLTGRMP